jgi:glutathione S-transferase
MYLPRPDLEALNVNYRRIPVLSIGRDVYCDSRLILRKLEQLFPEGAIGASDPDQRAIERLLERWTTDAGIFSRAVALIPTNLASMNDPAFRKDREGFSGQRPGGWSKEKTEKGRPEALAHIRDAFELLESTLLADGRTWILKTDKPSLADIEGKPHAIQLFGSGTNQAQRFGRSIGS